MGLFSRLAGPDINKGVDRCHKTEGAVLLDVRTVEEYAEGHIPGSINIPLQSLEQVQRRIPVKETPIFTYCASGARSSQAASILEDMGYTKVENIGGINSWKGEIQYR